jgi:hypothetical protein
MKCVYTSSICCRRTIGCYNWIETSNKSSNPKSFAIFPTPNLGEGLGVRGIGNSSTDRYSHF